MNIALIATAGMLLLAAPAGLANIPVPAECRSGQGADGFSAGVELEKRFIASLFRRLGDCHRFDQFVGAITVPFSGSNPTSVFLKCRELGLVEGLYEQVDIITDTCSDECLEAGGVMGAWQADIYCSIAAIFGPDTASGVVAACPALMCDQLSQDQCEVVFEDTAAADAVCRTTLPTSSTIHEGCIL
jgi:hypothetical protein